MLPAVLFSGCLLYCGLSFDSEEPMIEPETLPSPPRRSAEYAAYRNFAVTCDATNFAETTLAYDMGYGGVPASVGVYPLRAVAARAAESLVENHFRAALPGERPVFEIDMTPAFLSVRQNRDWALVKIKIDISCKRCDGTGAELFQNSYTADRNGVWVNGKVPIALYEAFNDIISAFLDDFRRKVPPDALLD